MSRWSGPRSRPSTRVPEPRAERALRARPATRGVATGTRSEFPSARYDGAVHVLAYWFARVALMFAVFVALWGLGWTPWFAVLAAAVIAWLISYAMFGAMHDAAARQMEQWVSRRFVSVEADEVAEDAETNVSPTPTAQAKAAPASPAAASRAKKRATPDTRPV